MSLRFGHRAHLLGLLMSLCSGCLHPLAPLRQRKDVSISFGRLDIFYQDINESDAERLKLAAQTAALSVRSLGEFSVPVRIYLLPTHDKLEAAVSKRGYDWLKAWATFDSLYVQAPSTWSEFSTSQQDIEELLTHELSHCLMYQVSSHVLDWKKKDIPLWFREGLASYLAQQGYRWHTLETLARRFEQTDGQRFLFPEDFTLRQESTWVYSAAHHAFVFFYERYGENALRQVLRVMKEGSTFRIAFERVVGIPPSKFTEDFRRYVRYRGFKSGRMSQMHQ